MSVTHMIPDIKYQSLRACTCNLTTTSHLDMIVYLSSLNVSRYHIRVPLAEKTVIIHQIRFVNVESQLFGAPFFLPYIAHPPFHINALPLHAPLEKKKHSFYGTCNNIFDYKHTFTSMHVHQKACLYYSL